MELHSPGEQTKNQPTIYTKWVGAHYAIMIFLEEQASYLTSQEKDGSNNDQPDTCTRAGHTHTAQL